MNYNMNYDEHLLREEELMKNYERLCERNPEKYENMPCYLPEFVKSLDEATYAYDTMRSCWVKVKEKLQGSYEFYVCMTLGEKTDYVLCSMNDLTDYCNEF